MSNQVNETQTQTKDVTETLVELLKQSSDNPAAQDMMKVLMALAGQEIHVDLNLKVGNLKIHVSAHTDKTEEVKTSSKESQNPHRRETVLNCEKKVKNKNNNDLLEKPVKSMRLQALSGLVN